MKNKPKPTTLWPYSKHWVKCIGYNVYVYIFLANGNLMKFQKKMAKPNWCFYRLHLWYISMYAFVANSASSVSTAWSDCRWVCVLDLLYALGTLAFETSKSPSIHFWWMKLIKTGEIDRALFWWIYFSCIHIQSSSSSTKHVMVECKRVMKRTRWYIQYSFHK